MPCFPDSSTFAKILLIIGRTSICQNLTRQLSMDFHLFANRLIRVSANLIFAYLLTGIHSGIAQGNQMNDMYKDKNEAESRDKGLKCTGEFKMDGAWMPCKNIEDYEKSVEKKKT
jgi:hypothetical protein